MSAQWGALLGEATLQVDVANWYLVMRDFTANTRETRWCDDITCIAADAKWLHLATVIDICSRKVRGWSATGHMRTSPVIGAIEIVVAALRRRLPPARHPPQHGPGRLELRQRPRQIVLPESQAELLHERRWTSKAQTRLGLFRRLSYYNRRRRHPALSYPTPAEFEQQLITSHTLSLVA